MQVGEAPVQVSIGGLQDLWLLGADGVQRFDSTTLRMRSVDDSASPGFRQISAGADGTTWATDHQGSIWRYQPDDNRFVKQDGSGSDRNQQLNLGSGWSRVEAGSAGSSTPALWLLRDSADAAGHTVYSVAGRLEPGQSLAQLAPRPVVGAPALRLLAVGDDETPWGIDQSGDLWTWDHQTANFRLLAAGVAGQIRSLQMIDQAQVWALDEKGALLMWDGVVDAFKPVPLDSPFWTRRSQLLATEPSPTWHDFALSSLGGFMGVPQTGGEEGSDRPGLVAFDTSELRMLRAPAENPTELELFSGETLQDNGVRQVGQNLAFNLQDQVHVTYMLNGSGAGQWEGAATIPNAQSGAQLTLQPGPSRTSQGERLPVLKATWTAAVDGNEQEQRYTSEGFVSPFGGLIFGSPRRDALQGLPASIPLLQAKKGSPSTGGSLATALTLERQSGMLLTPLAATATAKRAGLGDGITITPSLTTGLNIEWAGGTRRKLGSWDEEVKVSAVLQNGTGLQNLADEEAKPDNRLDAQISVEWEWEKALSENNWFNSGVALGVTKAVWDDQESPDRMRAMEFSDTPERGRRWDVITKPANTTQNLSVSLQANVSGTIEELLLNPKWSAQISAAYKLNFPLYSFGFGAIVIGMDIGGGFDFALATTGIGALTPFIVAYDKITGQRATKDTPTSNLLFGLDEVIRPSFLNNPVIEGFNNYALPAITVASEIALLTLRLLGKGGSRAGLAPAAGVQSDRDLASSINLEAMTELAGLEQLPTTNSEQTQTISEGNDEISLALKPSVALKGKLDLVAGEIDLAAKLKSKFTYDILNRSWKDPNARVELSAQINLFSWKQSESWDFPITRKKSSSSARPLLSAQTADINLALADSSGILTKTTVQRSATTALSAVDIQNPAQLDEQAVNDAILASVVRNEKATGIYKHLLDSNSGVYELGWVEGTVTNGTGAIQWEWPSARTIAGSAGFTTNVTLVSRPNGELSVAASHIGEDNPSLRPITDLAPGKIYRFESDPRTEGKTTILDDRTPHMGLTDNQFWAQLGSSMATAGRLRSSWTGDSLITGAGGINHGGGALYILNGSTLNTISNLSALENNQSPEKGLVIQGSRLAGTRSRLGHIVINGGDTNRDGFDEIFASAPGDLQGAGAVYMFYGGQALDSLAAGLSHRQQGAIDLDELDAVQVNQETADRLILTFEGAGARKGYGTILAGGNDLNGDGLSDPLMGNKADQDHNGFVEMWSSQPNLTKSAGGSGEADYEQSIPTYQRSLFSSSNGGMQSSSRFAIHDASSVGDLDGDGKGDIVLSSDARAALVFGDELLPVYWEPSELLSSEGASEPPLSAERSKTWTASWKDQTERTIIVSFSGRDRNNDGFIDANPAEGVPEIDWIAARFDAGNASDPVIAITNNIAAEWAGAIEITNQQLSFDINKKEFSRPLVITAGQKFQWSSADTGTAHLIQPRALRARLITSNAPGIVTAAGVGDFDGDGDLDLGLSQAGYRKPDRNGAGWVTYAGQTAVHYGGAEIGSAVNLDAPLAMEQNNNGASGVLINTGGHLTAVGDWNYDRNADILIRDPYATTNGLEQSGQSVLLYGRRSFGNGLLTLEGELKLSNPRAQVLQGSAAQSLAGASAAAGDFDGNRWRSLLIGAPNSISETALRTMETGVRVFTANQRSNGTWQQPQQIPLPEAAGIGALSTFTVVGERLLASWVRTVSDALGHQHDQLWVAFQEADGAWSQANLIHVNARQDSEAVTLGEVNALAMEPQAGSSGAEVLLAWTALDPYTGRSYVFQSTHSRQQGWSEARQQDLQALLQANKDAVSGSQLKLELRNQRSLKSSHVWASDAIVSEGARRAVVNVHRSGDLSQAITLSFNTRDLSASAGSQYSHREGTIRFKRNQKTARITIPIRDNQLLEHRNTAFGIDLRVTSAPDTNSAILLGKTPIGGDPALTVRVSVIDNDSIKMRAIDAGISLLTPAKEATGTSGAGATIDPYSIALIGNPAAHSGRGEAYATFVSSASQKTNSPGLDWKELNEIESLDSPKLHNQRLLNLTVRPDEALSSVDANASFGETILRLQINNISYFVIGAPGNPLDSTKEGRVYIVNASKIDAWRVQQQQNNTSQPLVLDTTNSLIIVGDAGSRFGAALHAARLSGSAPANNNQDLIIGAPNADQVYVFGGKDLAEQLKKYGQIRAEQLTSNILYSPLSDQSQNLRSFGSALSVVDLDSDGNPDLAIGAPSARLVRANNEFQEDGPIVGSQGEVYVVKGNGTLESFKGDVDQLVDSKKQALRFVGQKLVNARGSENDEARLASQGRPAPGGFGFGEELGSALAAVDLNADGSPDLALGGSGYTLDGISRRGRVVVWLSKDGKKEPQRWGESIDLSSVDARNGVTFVGESDRSQFGSSLSLAGDLQGDGHDDLAIGAPGEADAAGRVYVAFGSQNRYGENALKTTGNTFIADGASTNSPFQVFSAPAGYQLGRSIAALGDINNDKSTGIGGDDLFLGSPAGEALRTTRNQENDIQFETAGQTHLAWGRPWLGPNQELDVPFKQGVGYLLPFGGVPKGLGDLNGDGYDDYALLGIDADASTNEAGSQAEARRLRIRFGAPVEYEQKQLVLTEFILEKPLASPGTSSDPLVSSGDFNGDGLNDVVALTSAGLRQLFGSPQLAESGTLAGRLGTVGVGVGNNIDTPVKDIATGDFNGDGYDDLVILYGSLLVRGYWGSHEGLKAGGEFKIAPSRNWPTGADAILTIDTDGDGTDELALLGRNLLQLSPAINTNLYLVRPNQQSSNLFDSAFSTLSLDGASGAVTTALSTGDLNGDGRADLLVDRAGLSARLFLGQKNRTLQPSLSFQRQSPASDLSPSQLARFVGDTNGDGHDDLLFAPTSTQDYSSQTAYKSGPYSYVFAGTSDLPSGSVRLPDFWNREDDLKQRDLSSWNRYGVSIESLPGETKSYRIGGIGDINGDGIEELMFSSNSLIVNERVANNRPHSIAIYGSNRLTPQQLSQTALNTGSSEDDTIHQLGSAGKQNLIVLGKAGRDLLQVHADPYGASLSIPDAGPTAGRLTVSASTGDVLWSQPENAYQLVLQDGMLQIIRTKDGKSIQSWGSKQTPVDRAYLSPQGHLYLLQSGINDNEFRNPSAVFGGPYDRTEGVIRAFFNEKGVLGLAGWWENSGFAGIEEDPTTVNDSQLVFRPATGELYLVNRQRLSNNPDKDRDLWASNALDGSFRPTPNSPQDGGKTRSAYITLFKGDPNPLRPFAEVPEESLWATQVLNPGEGLLSAAGAARLAQQPLLSLDAVQTTRGDLQTFVGQPGDNVRPFGVKRTIASFHDRSLREIFAGKSMQSAIDDLVWSAPPVRQKGPYLAVMDGNGRLTINGVAGENKAGSVLQELFAGYKDPFLPPLGNQNILIRAGAISDQVSQNTLRTTNNNFKIIIKGGLDDDRLGIDSLERMRSGKATWDGLIDGGAGVDTLFFSTQRTDQQDPIIDLRGMGNRIRNIENIEIPINNTLEIDETILLNTPLHILKLESRGSATVVFHPRSAYALIGDQMDAGLAYSVYQKPNSNLQLWVQQGKVTLQQIVAADAITGIPAGTPPFPEPEPKSIDQILNFSPNNNNKIIIDRNAFGLHKDTPLSFRSADSQKLLDQFLSSPTLIVYDQRSGELYHNANGLEPGYGSGGIFAILEGAPRITASNLILDSL